MCACGLQSLVENYAKKNRSRFPIVVLLTTLICNHLTTTYFSLLFYNCNLDLLGVCSTPLERHFQDLFIGILQAHKFLKSHLVNKKQQ